MRQTEAGGCYASLGGGHTHVAVFLKKKRPLSIFGLTDSDSTAVLAPVCEVSEKAHSGGVRAFL